MLHKTLCVRPAVNQANSCFAYAGLSFKPGQVEYSLASHTASLTHSLNCGGREFLYAVRTVCVLYVCSKCTLYNHMYNVHVHCAMCMYSTNTIHAIAN